MTASKILYKKVAIVGVGLMGGSLGMALREKVLAEKVMGWGRSVSKLRTAQKVGAIGSWTLSREEALDQAGLLVFATPMNVTKQIGPAWFVSVPPGCLITDLGSVKGKVVEELTEITGPSLSYVSSHPLCGSEKTGVTAARPDLFEDRLCLLTPVAKTKKRALSEIQNLWQALGMRVVSMAPLRHDRIMAAVSHLPHLAAAALVNQVGDEKLLDYVGTGFLDSTRIAASDPLLWLEIIRQNRENISRQLELLADNLELLKKIIQEDQVSRLRAWLQNARLRRQKLNNS